MPVSAISVRDRVKALLRNMRVIAGTRAADASSADAAPPQRFVQPSPYDKVTLADAPKFMPTAPTAAADARAFYDGKHWQDGKGWIGPHPGLANSSQPARQVWMEIARAFTSQNVIAEVADRHVAGVVGITPSWAFSSRDVTTPSGQASAALDENAAAGGQPSAEEKALLQRAAEAEALLTAWIDERDVENTMHDAVTALMLDQRSVLRLSFPEAYATPDANGVYAVRAPSVEDAFAMLHLEHVLPERGTVHVDPRTKQKLGVFFFEQTDIYGQPISGKAVELSYIDPITGNTVLRYDGLTTSNQLAPRSVDRPPTPVAPTASTNGTENGTPTGDGFAAQQSEAATGGASGVRYSVNMGGRLPMFEMTRSAFITPQMIENQKALNFALTMVPRNVETGGFLERVITNAKMPGRYVEDANGDVQLPSGKMGRWVEFGDVVIGAGSTLSLVGQPIKDAQTGAITGYAPTGITYRPPVPVTPSVEAKDAHRTVILEEGKQAHVTLDTQKIPSGRSRAQSRADYEKSLTQTEQRVERAWRWLLETALAMAEAAANQIGAYTNGLRAVVQCVLDTGPLQPDEITAIMTAGDKHYLSTETVQSRLGVIDVDAENRKIAAQRGSQAALVNQMAAAAGVLVAQIGTDPDGALEVAGFSQEQITLLRAAEVQQENQQRAAEIAGTIAKNQQNAGAEPPADNASTPTDRANASGDGNQSTQQQ